MLATVGILQIPSSHLPELINGQELLMDLLNVFHVSEEFVRFCSLPTVELQHYTRVSTQVNA